MDGWQISASKFPDGLAYPGIDVISSARGLGVGGSRQNSIRLCELEHEPEYGQEQISCTIYHMSKRLHLMLSWEKVSPNLDKRHSRDLAKQKAKEELQEISCNHFRVWYVHGCVKFIHALAQLFYRAALKEPCQVMCR